MGTLTVKTDVLSREKAKSEEAKKYGLIGF